MIDRKSLPFFSRTLARLATVLVLGMLGSCAHQRQTDTFSFGVIGDLQYNAREELLFPKLLQVLDNEPLAFVVHVGDFKAGSKAPCTDALYQKRKVELGASVHGLVYLPGDNDWVDCRRPSNGPSDPLERLAKIREIFFTGNQSLGKNPIRLQRQSATFEKDPVLSRYKENVIWSHGGIVFLAVNVQGSNNNFGFDAASDAEYHERNRANIAWMKLATQRVRDENADGLAIFLQANPGFEEDNDVVFKSGFREFLHAFEEEAVAVGKPILFSHGDSHQFRVGRPYLSPLDKRPINNVTRLESYGTPNMNWVRVTVNRRAATLFTIESGGFVPQPAQ